MTAPVVPHLLLAAGPTAPGAVEVVERALAGSVVWSVMLSGEGLAWAAPAAFEHLAAGARVSVCSRHARDAGWTLADGPRGVRWTSVGRWLMDLDRAGAPLWVVLP